MSETQIDRLELVGFALYAASQPFERATLDEWRAESEQCREYYMRRARRILQAFCAAVSA